MRTGCRSSFTFHPESLMFELLQRMNGGELLGLCGILAVALVLCVLILVIGWASMSATRQQTTLKREMLERGMSVDDIERLSMSEAARQERLEAELKVRETQIAADLKRDLLARGLAVEQVM